MGKEVGEKTVVATPGQKEGALSMQVRNDSFSIGASIRQPMATTFADVAMAQKSTFVREQQQRIDAVDAAPTKRQNPQDRVRDHADRDRSPRRNKSGRVSMEEHRIVVGQSGGLWAGPIKSCNHVLQKIFPAGPRDNGEYYLQCSRCGTYH